MGGKSPDIDEDADLESVVVGVMFGFVANSGQGALLELEFWFRDLYKRNSRKLVKAIKSIPPASTTFRH